LNRLSNNRAATLCGEAHRGLCREPPADSRHAALEPRHATRGPRFHRGMGPKTRMADVQCGHRRREVTAEAVISRAGLEWSSSVPLLQIYGTLFIRLRSIALSRG
jgi:hypothetical protein